MTATVSLLSRTVTEVVHFNNKCKYDKDEKHHHHHQKKQKLFQRDMLEKKIRFLYLCFYIHCRSEETDILFPVSKFICQPQLLCNL